MKYALFLTLCLTIAASVLAQKRRSSLYLGAGIGLDHGGVGLKTEYEPFKYLGVFAGLGHDIWVGPSGNLGLIYNILPDQTFTPVLTAMMGINASSVVKYSYDGVNTNMISRGQYGGLTIGGGFDIHFGRRKNQKANFSLLIPFRDSNFHGMRRRILSQGGTIEHDAKPVLVALGWNIDLLNIKPKPEKKNL